MESQTGQFSMIHAQDHYVPVLKVKRGEKRALCEIHSSLKRRVMPLLEIVELTDSKKTLEKHLDTAFRDLAVSVESYPRCLLDCHELLSDWPRASEDVFLRARWQGMVFTPVTGVSRNNFDVTSAMNYREYGLALRLTREEFEDGAFPERLQRFMNDFGLTPEDIDLIVDLGPVDDMIAPGAANLAAAFLNDVPYHAEWRTFTISACGFPLSLGGVGRNSHDFAQRVEWMAWRDSLYQQRHTLQRLPMFSDCAIQHTAGVEGFDPRIMQVSASIRYTLSDCWLLIKGEGTRVRRPSVQFPELATALVYGHLQQYFCQADHCSGCLLIQHGADGQPGHGSPEAWRRYGTIHHITRVLEDLAELPYP